MKNDGYLKHPLSLICPICIYYKIKERINKECYNLDAEDKKGVKKNGN